MTRIDVNLTETYKESTKKINDTRELIVLQRAAKKKTQIDIAHALVVRSGKLLRRLNRIWTVTHDKGK